MKKLRFLLLSLLTMVLFTFAMGCEVAGDSCDTDADCGDKELCYAGYCGQNEPQGSLILEFNLRDIDLNEAMTCSEANIGNVNVVVTAHGFEVLSTTVPCSDLNVHELGDTAMGAEIVHLWNNKDYNVDVTFTDEVSKNFTAVPKIGGVVVPGEANDANVVKLEKVQEAVLTVKWDVSDGFGGVTTDCGEIESFRIAKGEIEACSADEVTGETVCDFADYDEIQCTSAWEKTYMVYEALVGESLNIYATKRTDLGVEVLFQHIENSFMVSQAQLDSGAFERTFTLKALGNKK